MSRTVCHASLIALLLAAPLTSLAATGYAPGIKIVLEDRTPQGDLRSFQRPGLPPTYWTQDLPVVRGDLVTIVPLISTGGAELAQVRARLDNTALTMPAAPPFRVEVKTADLAPGYHLIEVWAATRPPNARENTATTTFLVVPPSDALLRMMQGEGAEPPPVSDEERLAAVIHSLDPDVEKEIAASSTADVKSPTLFFVAAGAAAKEYFYTLTREGQLTYTSPKLPLQTQILLEPQNPDGPGLAPGTLILTVRVGDGQGRFGPPAWITVHIKASEAAK
jgi:hypothetical protein